MSCSPFDLRDYYLQELADPQQRQVESHLKDCPACRQELDQLRLTQAALFSLRDEEIPQRIAFVSDPVFEPSAPRRWWAAFWGSPARLGFSGAAMLSAALLFSTLTAWIVVGERDFSGRSGPADPAGGGRQRTTADCQDHATGARYRQAGR